MIHSVQVWPTDYQELASGKRQFDFRKSNSNYRKGDMIQYEEVNPSVGPTGAYIEAEITGVWPSSSIEGIQPGYKALSIQIIDTHTHLDGRSYAGEVHN